MLRLSIYLLGAFQVRLDDQIVSGAFRTEKERALLAFLAVESGRSHAREAIAELFWPERPEGIARTNLRQALLGVRRTIGDRVSETPFLIASDETITFNTEKRYWLDTAAFNARFQFTLTHPHKNLETCPTCAQHLQEAVDLYRGDFLSELFLPDSQGFQEWAMFYREQYFRYLLAALHNLSAYYQYLGDYELAHTYAWRHVNLAPLEESAHRRLMHLLALSGRRSAALEQYNTCRRMLAEELGVEPAPETTSLYEQIKNGSPFEKTRPIRPAQTSNLPAQFTSFVGRETELDWFKRCLPNPVCRLLTVVGMAGAGKTRLALEATAQNLELFPDGARFLPLPDACTADPLASTLAQLLGLPIKTQEDPRTTLFRFLGPLRTLLIIDHFDLYVEDTGLLLEILNNAPNLKLLVTSRSRLNFQAACMLPIQGLPYPSDEVIEQAQDYPAVQLFLARAERSRLDFSPQDKEFLDIVRICQLLEGLPLGIELAAARLRDFSCAQILEELQQGLDILQTSLQDVPKRHRSMRKAIDSSWEQLSTEEKTHFRRLSIFQGGFTLEAAEKVSQAQRSSLSSLTDKSMLYMDQAKRYQLQPLLKHYALEKLSEDPQEYEQIRNQHSIYYLEFLRAREAKLENGQHQERALDEIEADTENIRAALARASSQRKAVVLAKGIEALNRYYNLRESLSTKRMQSAGMPAVPGTASGMEMLPVIHKTLAQEGWCCGREGRFEDANDAILLENEEGDIIDANFQACQLTGYSREALLQLKTSDFMIEEIPLYAMSANQYFETKIQRANGTMTAVEITLAPLTDNGETHYLSIIREISDRGKAEGIAAEETLDPLTQLPNRMRFYALLRRAISSAAQDARQAAILLLDIDDLKVINQVYGHKIGDHLLQAVAERLKACLRGDDQVARISGDEFAILIERLPNTDTGKIIAEKILNALSNPFLIRDQEILISTSIGIGVYPSCGDNAESLVENADAAKDRAKARGKNIYHLFSE